MALGSARLPWALLPWLGGPRWQVESGCTTPPMAAELRWPATLIALRSAIPVGICVLASREWHPVCIPVTQTSFAVLRTLKSMDSIDRFGDRLERCVDRFPIRIQFSSRDACQSDCMERHVTRGRMLASLGWLCSPSLSSDASPPSTDTSDHDPRNSSCIEAGSKLPRSVAPPIPSQAIPWNYGAIGSCPSPSDLRHDPSKTKHPTESSYADSRFIARGRRWRKVRRRLQGMSNQPHRW